MSIRRVGRPPLPDQRYTLRPGAYAILPLRHRVLLTGQVAGSVDVQLPGGGIDPGESPVQALHREVREEIGWTISRPRRLGAFRRFVFMPEYDLWAEKLCHIFVAHPVMATSPPSEQDHITLVMSPADAAANLGNAGDRMFVQRYFRV